MKVSRSVSLLSKLLLAFLFVSIAKAQDDLPDLNTLVEPSGRVEETTTSSIPEPTSTAVETTEAPTAADATSVFRLTGLPTIAGALNPTVRVPDTSKAPYMHRSSLPEGTVFIAVGAALGALGGAILMWRLIVSWTLHRSVKRANQTQGFTDAKGSVRGPGGGVYSGLAGNSTLSLAMEKPNVLRSTRNFSPANSASPGPRGRPDARTASSLFFSPTAGNIGGAGNRSSSYLPAGYYASGASAPAGGASTTSLGPSAAGYNRAGSLGPSPPGSPRLPPSRGFDRAAPPSRGGDSIYRTSNAGTLPHSSSNLNLSAPPEGRAPSAYLEDLFEHHGNASREQL